MRHTLYTADWVLPVTAPPIADGAVLVDGSGVIRAVGPRSSIETGDDVAVIDLGAAILLPGLVNVHAHPELAAMRGLLEDLPFHLWIPALRRAKRGAGEAGDLGAAARWSCYEALASGVTTLAATEDSGAALDAMRESGMRGIVYREIFGPAPARASTEMASFIEKIEDMRRAETDLVRVGVSPHAPYTVSDELYRLVASYATTENLPVAVHIAESEVEFQLVTEGAGPFAAGLRTRGVDTPPRSRSPVQLLADTGILDVRPLLIHCVRVDDRDVQLIAGSGAAVAHCPIANARLGHGVAPVLDLIEAGVPVGLGSDSVAANNRIDMLEEARVAQLMQRARSRSSGALTPEALLRMLTIDAAGVLGLDARVGSLEIGKDADLCAIGLNAPHTWPVNDPIAAVMMSARGSDVILTVVRGAILYRHGLCTSLDPKLLRDRLRDCAARMRAARDA